MSKANDYQVEPVAWLTRELGTGHCEVAEPNEKAGNPDWWSDAFPVFAMPVSATEAINWFQQTSVRVLNNALDEVERLRKELNKANEQLSQQSNQDSILWHIGQTIQSEKYPLKVWECVETGRPGKWEERMIGFTVSENTCSGGFLDSFTLGPIDIDQSLVKANELTDEEVIEAMRKDLYDADGGYAVDTCPEFVVKAGRSLLKAAKEKNNEN